MRSSTAAVALGAAAALLGGALLGCGKKGPPLPPLPGMKPTVDDLSAWQVGDTVHASFTLPVRPGFQEVDYSVIGIELWRRQLERALELEEPAPPEEGETPRDFRRSGALAVSITGEDVFEWLSAANPVLVDPLPPEVLTGDPLEYALVLKTTVAKRGTLSNPVVLDPWPPPSPPAELIAEPLETGIRLAFTPPPPQYPTQPTPAPAIGDDAGRVTDESSPAEDGPDVPETSSEDEAGGGEPLPVRYEIYRAEGDRPFPTDPIGEPGAKAEIVDSEVVAGRRYRYVVRAIVERDGVAVRSAGSEEIVVDYRDVFAPESPSGLRAILEGRRAVALIWNPSTATDLAGYRVYRREPGGEWRRIDTGERRTATFTDRRVAPGTTYEYAVTAFDAADPPNESERSAPARITMPASAPGP